MRAVTFDTFSRRHRAGAKRRDPVIPIDLAPQCHLNRDGRDKPGHDSHEV
jgi:hypothetical protein